MMAVGRFKQVLCLAFPAEEFIEDPADQVGAHPYLAPGNDADAFDNVGVNMLSSVKNRARLLHHDYQVMLVKAISMMMDRVKVHFFVYSSIGGKDKAAASCRIFSSTMIISGGDPTVYS